MLVLGFTFGAVFITLGWAHRTYLHSRYDRESRELLFSWVQAFDSMWRPTIDDNTGVRLENRAREAIAAAASMMGGTVPIVIGGTHTTYINGFTLEITPHGEVQARDRRLNLEIAIRAGGRLWVNFIGGRARSFSGFPNDGIQDWREENDPVVP